MKKTKRVIKIVASVLLCGIILLAALFSFTTLATKDNDKLANIAGFTPLTVLTDSMEPEFSGGDLIIIKSCDPADLIVGEIVSFYAIIENEYALNTHRITEITENNGVRNYVTKGDNNDIEDSHIIADGDIVGRYVMKIPGMGNVMDFLSSSLGFLLVIILPMLLFLIYQIYNLITVSIEMKKVSAIENEADKNEELAAMQAKAQEALDEAEKLKAEAQEALDKAKNNKTE